jgi:hypothetical protein
MSCAIHVIHENAEWSAPLFAALQRRGLPYRDWFLAEGAFDLAEAPPDGVFYSRMSASSHTRGHRYAPEYTAAVLAWLESHDRRVVNTGRALQLEISKVAQYAALRRHGIRVPRTVPAVGRAAIVDAAGSFDGRFITKHNRAGKGLGVRLFDSVESLRDYVEGPDFEPPVDGITLVQDYIQAPEPCITRVEFVDGRFMYAVRVDTSDGFELCPADACALPGAARPKFRIVDGFESPLVPAYERFLAENGIEVAGIEFIVDAAGTAWTYDINTNTNYNPEAEAAAGRSGMDAIAAFLGRELSRQACAGARRAAAG